MQRVPLLTKDGSHTISIPEMGVTYHSTHGAIQESIHVFIEAGLQYYLSKNKKDIITIFEMGFGTGLNPLLTLLKAETLQQKISYHTIELYPLLQQEIAQLNYCAQLGRIDLESLFKQLHTSNWNEGIQLTEKFSFLKINQSIINHKANFLVDIIFFDAFDPSVQPALWSKEIFEKAYLMLSKAGVLVTYCCKGDVRRAMQAAGFLVTRIPGPPGKREMLRAEKINF
jgi:tRNA U34 5-methylaminomethyl-2-thiouridine-forming methyltransferase MnmC